MIIGNLKNTRITESLHPSFKKVFDYVNSTDLKTMIPTTTELQDRDIYLMIHEYIGKNPQEATMEAHQQYIDIQIPLIGQELIGWETVENCDKVKTPYNDEKDVIFFATSPSMYITLHPDEFVIFFPEDVHAPGIGIGELKKVVFKVKI
ncbi:MAG: YhcH/YjgK/YiaL family protein [Bacteroidota bacterium]